MAVKRDGRKAWKRVGIGAAKERSTEEFQQSLPLGSPVVTERGDGEGFLASILHGLFGGKYQGGKVVDVAAAIRDFEGSFECVCEDGKFALERDNGNQRFELAGVRNRKEAKEVAKKMITQMTKDYEKSLKGD